MPDIKYAQTEAVDKGSPQGRSTCEPDQTTDRGSENHDFLFGQAGFHGGGGKRR